jgi:hypothetical protein
MIELKTVFIKSSTSGWALHPSALLCSTTASHFPLMVAGLHSGVLLSIKGHWWASRAELPEFSASALAVQFGNFDRARHGLKKGCFPMNFVLCGTTCIQLRTRMSYLVRKWSLARKDDWIGTKTPGTAPSKTTG